MNSSTWGRPHPCPRDGTAGPGRSFSRRGLALILAVLALPILVFACGPFFPNSLLGSGDDAVLQSPAANFVRELDRLKLEAPPRLPSALKSGTDREVTVDAEIFDLRRALGARSLPSNELAERVLAFSRSRADLEDHRRAVEEWSAPREPWMRITSTAEEETATNRVRPSLKFAEPPAGLPREFEIYLRGAAAWYDERTNEAREAWSRVLALPKAERPYKSTWAAFMLGRSWHESDPRKAVDFYGQTRQLARSGLSDSAGLAIASLGWEAQLRLRSNDFAGALRLYLDQYAAGSTNAALSLRFTAGRIVAAEPEVRLAIARDPVFRRVVTAWILSTYDGWHVWSDDTNAVNPSRQGAIAWLDTVEAAGVAEVPLAEQLSVLAYQAGQWEVARRWVDLSGDSPVAGWIRAKLLLRDGKVGDSAAELARVIERVPLEPPAPASGETPMLVDSLFEIHERRPARNEILGELGVLRVARGEFVQALDALLRAGFWEDAAYVAERILTTDELRSYVDASWPALSGKAAEAEAKLEPGPETVRGQRERIRWLLARRLNRTRRGPEAVGYFSKDWQPVQTRFLELLRQGADSGQPPRDRARAWFQAAWIARTNGMELLGTELGPDYAIHEGQFEEGVSFKERSADEAARVLRPTVEEEKRSAEHASVPDERFHYRYSAARLAWEAAALLPNNDPETATILWTGGRWLKNRDPKRADLFYKALVRRCRKTELGDAADRQRWFPELDEQGHPIVTRGRPEPLPEKETVESADDAPDADAAEAPADAADDSKPADVR